MPLHEKTKALLRRLKAKKNKQKDDELIERIYSVNSTKSTKLTKDNDPIIGFTFSQKVTKGKVFRLCIPCAGTGRSSRGEECYPCCGTGKEGERVRKL